MTAAQVVYILFGSTLRDGSDVLGVFTTKEAADAEKNRIIEARTHCAYFFDVEESAVRGEAVKNDVAIAIEPMPLIPAEHYYYRYKPSSFSFWKDAAKSLGC